MVCIQTVYFAHNKTETKNQKACVVLIFRAMLLIPYLDMLIATIIVTLIIVNTPINITKNQSYCVQQLCLLRDTVNGSKDTAKADLRTENDPREQNYRKIPDAPEHPPSRSYKRHTLPVGTKLYNILQLHYFV